MGRAARRFGLNELLWVAMLGALAYLSVPVALCLVAAAAIVMTVHELGHVVAARMLGFRVARVEVGTGPALRLRVGDVPVRVGVFPISGLTAHEPPPGERRPARLITVTMAGVAAQLVLGVAVWFTAGTTGFGATVLAVDVVAIIPNLVPFSSRARGQSHPSDALAAIRVFRARHLALLQSEFTRAYERGDLDRAYGAAIEAMKQARATRDDFRVSLSAVLIAGGETDRALALLDRIDTRKSARRRMLVANNRACAKLDSGSFELQQQGCDEALAAFGQWPDVPAVRATWAAALVQRRHPAEAIDVLDAIDDDKARRPALATRALTRARALLALGRGDEAAEQFALAAQWPPLLRRIEAERAAACR